MINFDLLLYIYKWVALGVILLFVVDIGLIFYANKHSISLNSRYFSWHEKLGAGKFSVLKTAYVLWLLYDLLNPPGNAGAVGVAAFIYCYAVVTLIIAFFQGRRAKKEEG